MDTLVIRSEEDAWAALQASLRGEIDSTAQMEFEGWPVFRLTLKGEDFNGSIPTRVMPPILTLQREIHRLYCQAAYGTEDTRKLTASDREKLELVVQIKPGSTEFITELFEVLNEAIKNSNMNGAEVVTLFVGIAAIIATSVGWKQWVASRERRHGQDVSVRLSEEETKRLDIVTEAMSKRPELEENQRRVAKFQGELSKQLQSNDQLSVDGVDVIRGERAAEIVPAPKEEAREVRLDGEYTISQVKFPKKAGNAYRFSLLRVSDRKEFLADSAPELLTAAQIQILKDGGFGLKSVFMEINAKQLKGRISGAKIVSIKWPD